MKSNGKADLAALANQSVTRNHARWGAYPFPMFRLVPAIEDKGGRRFVMVLSVGFEAEPKVKLPILGIDPLIFRHAHMGGTRA